jgi:hypothetical protein
MPVGALVFFVGFVGLGGGTDDGRFVLGGGSGDGRFVLTCDAVLGTVVSRSGPCDGGIVPSNVGTSVRMRASAVGGPVSISVGDADVGMAVGGIPGGFASMTEVGDSVSTTLIPEGPNVSISVG